MRILYVEDDPLIREELQSFLRHYSAEELYTASDGEEGVALFRSTRPDLVLTDIIMPRLDGLEMIRRIREIDPEVPILMVTANSDSDFFAESIELHVDGYIPKPIDLDLLDHKLTEVRRKLELRRAFEFQKNLLQEIAQLQGNMLVVLNREMETIFINRRMAKFLGVDPDRTETPIIQKAFWESLGGDGECLDNPDRRCDLLEEIRQCPLIDIPTKQGTPQSFSVDIVHVEESGHTLVTFSEVTRLMQTRREYEHRASHDPLTGLGNRFLCDREMLDALFYAGKERRPLSIALIDLDHFKAINDRYGHLTGDDTLVEFAGLLSRSLEGSMQCFRWGGEEFVLLMPDTDLTDALAFCDRLREAIGKTPLTSLGITVTASFGVAQMQSPDETPTQLFDRADRALLKSKRSGRNRVVPAADSSSRSTPDAQ